MSRGGCGRRCVRSSRPRDGAIHVEVSASERERALRTAVRLQRRFDDLVGDRPDSEGEANRKLASGYQLATDTAVPRSMLPQDP